MSRSKLQTFVLPLTCALVVNGFLFMGIASLCQDNPRSRRTTDFSPIHLNASRFAPPCKTVRSEQPQPAPPAESPQKDQKPPPPPSQDETDPPPRPVTAAEIPASQPAAPPEKVAAAPVAKPKKQHKTVAKPRRSMPHEAEPTNKNRPAQAKSSATAPTAPSLPSAGEHSQNGAPKVAGSVSGPREFTLGQVDQAPRILSRKNPRYPVLARRRKLTGKVTVKFLVDRYGKVRKPKIIEAHPRGVFEQSVLESITKWSFKPAIYRGNKVATWVVLPIQFRLKGG